MKRISVESSSLKSVGYLETERRLEVEFTSGSVYDYLGVPPAVHEALMESGSNGTAAS